VAIPKRTKVALSIVVGDGMFHRVLSFFFIAFTKYKAIKLEGNKFSEHLFIISSERKVRADHQQVFQKVYDECFGRSNGNSLKVEYKRVINNSLYSVLHDVMYSKFSVHRLLELQMDKVVNRLPIDNVKDVIVFCDTVLLSNYIVECCQEKDIPTFGMQHGFYPDSSDLYWRRVYLASNTENFFAWDKRTVDLMSAHSGIRHRKFIEAGPTNFSLNDGMKNKKMDPDRRDAKNETLESVAIYGAGLDQREVNVYLVGLARFLAVNSDVKVTFICHPYFKLWRRVVGLIQTRVIHHSNASKNKAYDLHVVLNSSVWLELDMRNFAYIRLDDFYNKGASYPQVLDYIFNCNAGDVNNNDTNMRVPFLSGLDALDRIVDSII